ncbi:adenylosuccinate synthetase [Nisaea sp.]|uniref:adenylosuccinate synthetase n=1 Tax=Nisaea sp. TaxID=2024842 RepID=UPI002B2770F1|nr:adenylosuccinate synthetase [Nisaea sp.]
MRQIILISGHTCNGKSALAGLLKSRYNFEIFKTSSFIQKIASQKGKSKDRQSLKRLGDDLDSSTDHRWLKDEIDKFADSLSSETPIVVDSIRKAEQLEVFRNQLDYEVTHVHLYATRKVLEDRFKKRQIDRGFESKESEHQEVDLIKSEEDIRSFREDADVRIFTDRTDTEDTFVRVAAYLGLFPSPDRRCVDVLIGGQYGSEGKGQVAGYLAQEYDVLMRVGGPNAGHKVARESGKYTYHSLPSGSRESEGDILIGPGATIYIPEFVKEVSDCAISKNRIYLDPNVMIISDEDREEEKALKKAIGSTGRGGGAAAARRIMGRLGSPDTAKLARDYPELTDFVKPTQPRLQIAYAAGERVLLEGTQGCHLSLYHGQYPYVTSRDTNVAGCLAEAGISPTRVNRIMMVIRYTPIRVQSPEDGHSGDLKHETDFVTIAREAGIPEDLAEQERTSTTNLRRRVGWFEWEKFRQACELNAPTDIILTFADYQKAANRDARRFEQLEEDTIKFVEELERVAQAPVSLINTRFPHEEDAPLDLRTLIDRRDWRAKFDRVGNRNVKNE